MFRLNMKTNIFKDFRLSMKAKHIYIESKRRYFTRNHNKNNLHFQELMECCELIYISNHLSKIIRKTVFKNIYVLILYIYVLLSCLSGSL
jgi:hypothetical protein